MQEKSSVYITIFSLVIQLLYIIRNTQKTAGGRPCVCAVLSPTYKLYSLLEVRTDVCHVAVLHRDPLVLILALGGLQVSAGHVEQGSDVKVAEIVLSGGVVGTAEVEERQDLHRFTLGGGKTKTM